MSDNFDRATTAGRRSTVPAYDPKDTETTLGFNFTDEFDEERQVGLRHPKTIEAGLLNTESDLEFVEAIFEDEADGKAYLNTNPLMGEIQHLTNYYTSHYNLGNRGKSRR